MTSDLDKYGLVALTVIIVLILFIAISDLKSDGDPELRGISFDDRSPRGGGEPEEDAVVVIAPDGSEPDRPDFDFLEPPVDLDGSLREAGERESGVPDGEVIHSVRKGENLSKISQQYYGTATRWKRIADANPGVNANRLMPGQKLRIPQAGRDSLSPPPGGGEPKTAPGSATSRYRVKRGDTLGKIARRFYGSAAQWRKIQQANQSRIKDPKKLPIGMMLEIPR
jgi:nucleoid-associated protein YgaU